MSNNATVIFADSRRLGNLLPKNSVDLVLTGPPYWNEVVYSDQEGQLSKIDNYSVFLGEISKVWQSSSVVLKEGGILAIWAHDFLRKEGDDFMYIPFHLDLIKTIPSILTLRCIRVWDRYLNKDRGPITHITQGSRVQYILIFQKEGIGKNDDKIRESVKMFHWQPVWYKKTTPKLLGSGLVFRFAFNLLKPPSNSIFNQFLKKFRILKDDHEFSNYLTECPREVSDLIINLFSDKGDVVLDPFTGSGTTLRSALDLSRKPIGIEINENCADIISSKLSGQVIFKNKSV